MLCYGVLQRAVLRCRRSSLHDLRSKVALILQVRLRCAAASYALLCCVVGVTACMTCGPKSRASCRRVAHVVRHDFVPSVVVLLSDRRHTTAYVTADAIGTEQVLAHLFQASMFVLG